MIQLNTEYDPTTVSKSPSPENIAAHEVLRRKLDASGKSTKLEKAAGLFIGYFAQQRKTKTWRMDFGSLIRVLRAMGVDPHDFLDEALEAAERIEDIVGADPAEEEIKKVLGVLGVLDFDDPDDGATPGAHGAAPKSGSRSAASGRGPTTAAAITSEELREIDELRYKNPNEAQRRLLDAELTTDLVVEYLGVAGSVYRMLVELDSARRCLRLALFLAQGNTALGAELLLRLAHTWGADGRFQRALEIATEATGLFSRIGDAEGVGKALYLQGFFLRLANRLTEAEDALARAESRLRMAPEYLSATLHLLAACARDRGNGEEASELLDRAASIPDLNSAAVAKMVWLKATLQIELRKLEDAEGLLAHAAAELEKVELIDFALASVQLIWVRLRLKRPGAAWRQALKVRFLVFELEDNPIVAAAISNLVRGGQSAMTEALVGAVGSILEEKLRTPWRVFPAKSAAG